VAAPYHVNTQDDVRIDYINTQAGFRLFNCNDGRPSPCARPAVPFSMADRVRDIGAILDKLPEWFGDRVDVSRAGVLGHSRGTVTALAAAGGSAAWSSTLNCQAAPADLRWPLEPEPRVKAIMGRAIGARPITFGANLADVRVPALLVAGGLDEDSGAGDQLGCLRCDLERREGPRLDSASDPPQLRLDLPCADAGRGRPGCYERGTRNPRTEFPPSVGPPSVCITTRIPCTGLDTDVVKRAMKELAVASFGTVL
jgi:hypothetical protein